MAQIKHKICPICGREFETNSSMKVYCSGACHAKSQRHRGKRTKRDELPQFGDEEYSESTLKKLKKTKNTVLYECRHPDCCHRGHAGHLVCCDYLFHTGKRRPHAISECPGYTRKLRQIDEKGKVIHEFNDVEEAADTLGVSKNEIQQCMRDKSVFIYGTTFRFEKFKNEGILPLRYEPVDTFTQ